MDSYSKALEKIKYDQKCKPSCCVGPTGPRGMMGPIGKTGPTGPIARCNKSSIYIFKW